MVAKKGVKASEEEDLSRDPLQAIILADSFTKELGPITLECPKVLLPLVNTPMIDYTLAWLESAGVEQVFVLCRSHSKQIVNYLDNSKWVNKPNFSVTAIESHNCASAGDALRLIYERNVIQGDFILVSGDTVSNIMLTQALEEHEERKGEDKDAVMTMVIRQKSEAAQAIGTDEFIMGIDPSTKELLYYADKADNIKFDKQNVTSNPCFALYNDKEDCYIDICSPKILSLFTDKYDYQDLRCDFVKGLLFDGLMGCKIFTHEVDSSCYAARIDSFGSYDLISKDIIQRRFVPDVQFSITKSDACNITQSQVSRFTYIGNNTMISNSVVGDGCKIGCNVVIDGCYIWDNVRIEDGCKLRHAILCDGAVMKSGAVLERGVILSYKVVVGQEIVVPSYSKVYLLPQPDSDEELEYNSLENGNDGVVSDMGEDGRGFIWSMNNVEEWRHLVAPIPEADVKSHHYRIFEELVETIFLRAVHADGKCTDTLRRLQLLHLTFGMDPAECAAALLRSIMKLAVDTWKNSGNDLAKEITVMISKCGSLLKPFLLDVDEKIEVISKLEEMLGSLSRSMHRCLCMFCVFCMIKM